MKTKFFTVFLFFMSVQMSTAQWELTNSGMENIAVLSLACNGNTIFAGTQTGGVYFSSNNGATWSQTSLNDQDVRSLAADNDNIYAGSYSGNGVYRSTDNGTSWTQSTLNNRKIRSLAVSGNYVYAGAWTPDFGVYKSTDKGATWTQTALNQIVRSIAVYGNNVYAGSGTFPGGDGVFLSTNYGDVWNQTSLNNDFIGSIAVDGNFIVAGSGSSRGLYTSTNNGVNWTQNLLNNTNVYALEISGNNIYAGTYNFGVYVSNDSGINWTQRNDGLLFSGALVYDLCQLNNKLFAGLGFAGNVGVYGRLLSQLTEVNPISNEVPNKFSLLQNYPNPFNPETQIGFRISETGFVSLKVYSELGKEVQTLVNEKLSPGIYDVNFDGSNLSSGIYFYKIQAGNYSEVKKMTLLK